MNRIPHRCGQNALNIKFDGYNDERENQNRIQILYGHEECTMPSPRKQLTSLDDTSYYHITYRGVRSGIVNLTI